MNNRRPQLKVLLVGITDYPDAPLYGCVKDAKTMKQLLTDHYDADKYDLDLICLTNEKATRKEVIHNFLEHFGSLENGDQALFYFSGHGSQTPTPKVFWHNTPNHKLETLVLFDSRTAGGYDLVDKELAYLIWKVTYGTDVVFTMIADCCHSGGISKGTESNTRQHPKNEAERSWKTFYGAEYYRIHNNQVTIPQGNYLVFAACRANEEAKEKFLNGDFTGVFTHCLKLALRQAKGNLTFSELLYHTQLQVYNQSAEQSPQIDTNNNEYLERIFLGNSFLKYPTTCILHYNHKAKEGLSTGWMINMGAIHGLKVQRGDDCKLLVYDSYQRREHGAAPKNILAQLDLLEVFPKHTTVSAPDHLSTNGQYHVAFNGLPVNSLLRVGFSQDSDTNATILIRNEWLHCMESSIDLVADWEKARYLIEAKDNQYTIRPMGESYNNVFEKLQGYTIVNAKQILEHLETIAQWHRVKELANPVTTIKIDEVELYFYEVLKTSDNYMEVEEERPIPNFLSVEPKLNYQFRPKVTYFDSIGLGPMFRLKIKNSVKNTRKLWFSVLFLEANYGISNDLMRICELEPGEEKCLEYYDKNESAYTSVIPLEIHKAYLNHKVFKLREFIKIIISTHEFSTNVFNQDPVPFDQNLLVSRSVGRTKEVPKPIMDWTTIDFSIQTVYDEKNQQDE